MLVTLILAKMIGGTAHIHQKGIKMTREEFMEIVYDELHSDGDNNRANRIIDAADEYAETEQEPKWISVDYLPDTNIGNMSENPTGSNLVEPQESEE